MELLNVYSVLHEVHFQESIEWPENTSAELKDIVTKLLCPNLANRLGYSDVKGSLGHSTCDIIKKHAFFAGTSWEATKVGSFAVSGYAGSHSCARDSPAAA
jgi:hypothetical protein